MRGFDYHHCSTALQDDMMVREGLANLTPRERRLNRLAGIAVDQFRAGHGRSPKYRDRRWGQSVVAQAALRSQAEADFLIVAMESHIRARRELEQIGADMCGTAQTYAGMGFGHTYRGVMPECF